MAVNYLITGYWGEKHITPENDRGINAAMFGKGKFVLPVGEQFRAEYIGNNTVRIYDGKLMNNGAAAGIPAGEYVDLLISNTEQGKWRTDYIVFRYTKDASTLIEKGEFVVLKGEEVDTGREPVAPEMPEADLLTDTATLDHFQLYMVDVEGTHISAPVPLFNVSKSLATAAPSGFGLGDVSKLTTDLNAEKSNGWYFFGASALNRPQHIQYGCLFVANRSGSEVEQVQLAFSPLDGTRAQRRYRNKTDDWSEWEYENPPLSVGVEYRTTERWIGDPVYIQVVDYGKLPNNTTKSVAHGISNVKLVLDVFGQTSYGTSLQYSGVTTIYGSTSGILITTNTDLSEITAYVAIKYTKK